MTKDWTVQIYAPGLDEEASGAAFDGTDSAVETHSNALAAGRGSAVVEASVESIKENWAETVRSLTAIGDGLDDSQPGWGVSQIEVGLTLSATGKLLFIAEASAEASVTITLARRGG